MRSGLDSLLHPSVQDDLGWIIVILFFGFWVLRDAVFRVGSVIEGKLDRVIELLEERHDEP